MGDTMFDFETHTPEGLTFTPWSNGFAVGFRVTREQDDRVEYVVLNPSSDHGTDEMAGKGDVFVYTHAVPSDEWVDDPVLDGTPAHFYSVFEEEN